MKQCHVLTLTILSAVLCLGSRCVPAHAQTPEEPSGPPNSSGAPVAAPADLEQAILEWTPPALMQLSASALAKESFTLDRTMLIAAAGLMPDADADVRQSINKLDGVSVHMLRFGSGGAADPAAVEAIRQAYHLRGWKHVVHATQAGDPAHDRNTDVWLVMDGINIRGAAVLIETPKSVTLATVAGNLSPVDLLHLRGRFGIPRFESGELDGDAAK